MVPETKGREDDEGRGGQWGRREGREVGISKDIGVILKELPVDPAGTI